MNMTFAWHLRSDGFFDIFAPWPSGSRHHTGKPQSSLQVQISVPLRRHLQGQSIRCDSAGICALHNQVLCERHFMMIPRCFPPEPRLVFKQILPQS